MVNKILLKYKKKYCKTKKSGKLYISNGNITYISFYKEKETDIMKPIKLTFKLNKNKKYNLY